MSFERRVVDNRVFLLGLDYLYRERMKLNEGTELLSCARRVASELHVQPAPGPVEGYYAEDARLTEYFGLMWALQNVGEAASATVRSLPEFHRLRDVASSPLYGRPQDVGKLLPIGRDALAQALLDTTPDWTVSTLTAAADAAARATDDISFVGLAALAEDAVVLAAARESVVLYAEWTLGAAIDPPSPKYDWQVDEHLAAQTRRFIDTFHALFGEKQPLPPPVPEHAERYWYACGLNQILGRCVRLGLDDRTSPARHYHWAIYRDARGETAAHDFWSTEIWTTARYLSTHGTDGWRPEP